MGANLPAEMESDMFDTMTLTKTVGALCGSLLVFMLGAWVAEIIFSDGHGDHHEQMFVVFVEGAEEDAAPVEEGPSFEELYAVADPAAGEGEFRPCAACHSVVAGENGAGPYLAGIVGRPVQSAQGFENYSGALIAVNPDTWTPEALNAFLEKPDAYAPDTSMNFGGIRRAEDRANLIAYLATLGG